MFSPIENLKRFEACIDAMDDLPEEDEIKEILEKAKNGDEQYIEAINRFMGLTLEGENPFDANDYYMLIELIEEIEEELTD